MIKKLAIANGVVYALCIGLTKAKADDGRLRPRLAVLIVVDQMRADYLERWKSLFCDGGFRRLQQEGAWYRNCHYPYASTMTAPGHASIATGCSPDKHGIVMNEWLDRSDGKLVYCVASDSCRQVPPRENEKGLAGKKSDGMSPERLMAPTIGDALGLATNGRSKVVSLSHKERAAILMGGRQPYACYWFDTNSGRAITSSYFRERLHPWVEEFNRNALRDSWFGNDWIRYRADIDYFSVSGSDEVEGEGTGIRQGRSFPHPMNGGSAEPGKPYYEALYNSPFGNELLLALALKAIDAERLGSGETPDLLCVSFSCNDVAGHCWGPDSQEVMDVTLRTDDLIRRLLEALDSKVGKEQYLVVLTADHGICPLPEVSRKQGADSGRIPPAVFTAKAEVFLQTHFGKGFERRRWIDGTAYPWIYLNRSLIHERGLDIADVEDALASWIVKQPGFQAAYTRSRLLKGLRTSDGFEDQERKSFHPDRCGDVSVVTKPNYLLSSFLTGTSHGTPHAYDTHVPLLVFGTRVKSGVHSEPITPQTAAVILAGALGIPAPKDAEASMPVGLFLAK